jgi:uncharacterized protein DUF1566
MNIFKKLNLSDTTTANIEWDMTPDLAFCTFSAKGLRDELTSTDERVCYFFIDNYGDNPKLYLMERGTRHVNILAEILAPLDMLTECIFKQGGTASSKDNFSIDSNLKEWLIAEVVEADDCPFLIPTVEEKPLDESWGKPLPVLGEISENTDRVKLPAEHCSLSDDEIHAIIKRWDFYDMTINPQGMFNNALASTGLDDIIIDERTGLMWQRYGLDLASIREIRKKIEELNQGGLAGFHNWRMPTVEEAMSLMEPAPNAKGVHLHPCFSKELPFVFVAAKRTPTGYWFVDYKQGKTYWSSGTVPGGFCRACRSHS